MSTVEHRELRSALEFAVLIAEEGAKRRPPLTFPSELRSFFGTPRLATSSLGKIRRIVEADDTFRAALATAAVPELVDDVGQLWLAGGSSWERDAATLIEMRHDEVAESEARRELKRADKRRAAAERATARVQAELLVRDARISEMAGELDELRAELAKAEDLLAEVRTELIDTRNEARHARDREAAANARAERARRAADAAPSHGPISEPSGDRDGHSDGSPSTSAGSKMPSDHRSTEEFAAAKERLRAAEQRLLDAAAASRLFVDEIEALLAPSEERAPSSASGGAATQDARMPIRLPGGVISTSAVAARHLIAADAPIFVDGYNVAKLAWPDRSLEAQREALIARCEGLARRRSAAITVVFDGDSVPGAHAAGRRSIRVVYSPSGTSADDVIRAEVAHVPLSTPVVVVTDDREIVRDVKRAGANVIGSNAFIAVL
jgi:hypothetical protein